MKNTDFEIKFPNGKVTINAGCEKDALILALSDRILSGYALNPISIYNTETKDLTLLGTEYRIIFEN